MIIASCIRGPLWIQMKYQKNNIRTMPVDQQLLYLDILKWQATLICILLNCNNEVFVVGIIASSCVVVTSPIVSPVPSINGILGMSSTGNLI